ncbi:PREDICTED: probable disease resistance protein At4g33300 [Nelumbo nucifera]|uniref:RPW8 domain-containing protein n=2 Tax=Nelumbo nucifera TaxID=4432 RepID=A0A822ZFX0_NELNU|nr:PREDICTED: probable disease resistance protein At4g33300 [Nelumbo nucifera]DAD40528.1 TPA_asm: hypothetical protein HUJ06_014851 [Nelumbo nucifera]
MAVTDFFAGEIATELIKQLIAICKRSTLCKTNAEQLMTYVEELLPVIQEIKYSGIELPQVRQSQLDRISEILNEGSELCRKVLASSRWHVYKNLQLARKMEKFQKKVENFIKGPMQAHILADVHHLRFESAERFDRLEGRLAAIKIGVSDDRWLEEAVKRVEEDEMDVDGSVNFGAAMVLGKKKVKDMIIGRDDLRVVEIWGMGGSGKTTLAREICNDEQVRSHFNNMIFLTVSQSPNLEQLKQKLWKGITGNHTFGSGVPDVPIPQVKAQYNWIVTGRSLVVLDDVWCPHVLEQLVHLVSRIPGCKILVVSRFKFTSGIDRIYELELLKEDEAMSLFCYSAFGQKGIPFAVNEKLVEQIVKECKGLPLALKVIGASLRDQPEMYWKSVKNRLSRSESICESYEMKLLERMAISIEYLPGKVRECFLDLGCFPEDKKIPLDILINIWVEIHDLDEEEAFAILTELSNKNLLTLVKDARTGDISSSCEISITQHDVLRDLALHLSKKGVLESLNKRKRLIMPRREDRLPKEWRRGVDQPFDAQIVSIHTGEMKELDWFHMDFPKAEVLILNFSAKEYFLPPFIERMPELRALVLINYDTVNAVLHNSSILSSLENLQSLWLEKVTVPQLNKIAYPLRNLHKISLVLCKVNEGLDGVDLPSVFPRLSELTMDHCIDLIELPSSLCNVYSLKSLSITNCHSLQELPLGLGGLKSLRVLRIYACPSLMKLPPGICELERLSYLDISQCVNLGSLPERIGRLIRLEKIDMWECAQIINLPGSIGSLRSLRRVICDEEIAWLWKGVKTLPDLRVQVAQECFTLDWLAE